MKGGNEMGLKSIDMQVAITRSQDASKMQDQMMRQGQQFQDTLTSLQLREEVLKRTQVNEHEKVMHYDQDEENKRGSEQEARKKREQENQKKQQMSHPYLGTKIDYSR